MTLCTCLSRSGLTIINLLFCAIGATLLFLGTFLFLGYAHYSHGGVLTQDTVLLPALILLVVGIMAIVLGAIGCVAACQDQKCITGLYFTMLLLLLMGLITGGILSFIYHYQIDDGLHKVLLKGLEEYSKDEIKEEVDVIQTQFSCCGVDNATDWLNTPWYKNQSGSAHQKPYPHSCCAPQNCTYKHHDIYLHHRGCYTLMKEEMKKHLLIVACVAGAFTFILVVGMMLSCVLLMQKRKRAEQVPYVVLPSSETDGMRI